MSDLSACPINRTIPTNSLVVLPAEGVNELRLSYLLHLITLLQDLCPCSLLPMQVSYPAGGTDGALTTPKAPPSALLTEPSNKTTRTLPKPINKMSPFNPLNLSTC